MLFTEFLAAVSSDGIHLHSKHCQVTSLNNIIQAACHAKHVNHARDCFLSTTFVLAHQSTVQSRYNHADVMTAAAAADDYKLAINVNISDLWLNCLL